MPEPKYYWVCRNCGWIYDPEKGDPEVELEPGTDFDSLPINYSCPRCGADKSFFEEEHTYAW